jgi:3-hydroxyacyl-[acyl-carrier-protein] dehydratase
LEYCAKIEQLSEDGAWTTGTVKIGEQTVAEIDLMFSHIDKNMGGVAFPEQNFVFTEQFRELLKSYRSSTSIGL